MATIVTTIITTVVTVVARRARAVDDGGGGDREVHAGGRVRAHVERTRAARGGGANGDKRGAELHAVLQWEVFERGDAEREGTAGEGVGF